MTNKELRLRIRYLGEGCRLPTYSHMGLCSELYIPGISRSQRDKVLDLMRGWPSASKDRDFPVPHPTKDPVDAYYARINKWTLSKFKNKDNLQYILNRLSMCRYIAKQLHKLPEWR